MSRQGTWYDREGNRWYKHPQNPTRNYAGVTSVLNTQRFGYLETAKINGIVNYAARHRAQLAEYSSMKAVSDILKNQDEVLPDWRVAREFGNATHQVIENIINGKPLDHLVKEVEGTSTYPCDNTFTTWVPRYWDQFYKAHDVEVVGCENSVVSDRWGYAGSYDFLLMLDGQLSYVDGKTNAKGPHRWSTSLQNKAYAKADYELDFITGEQTERAPVLNSYLLWLRPEGWNLWPLDNSEEVWKDFYARLWLFQRAQDRSLDEGEPLHEDGLQPPQRWRP